jgi:hypothetical protein
MREKETRKAETRRRTNEPIYQPLAPNDVSLSIFFITLLMSLFAFLCLSLFRSQNFSLCLTFWSFYLFFKIVNIWFLSLLLFSYFWLFSVLCNFLFVDQHISKPFSFTFSVFVSLLYSLPSVLFTFSISLSKSHLQHRSFFLTLHVQIILSLSPSLSLCLFETHLLQHLLMHTFISATKKQKHNNRTICCSQLRKRKEFP